MISSSTRKSAKSIEQVDINATFSLQRHHWKPTHLQGVQKQDSDDKEFLPVCVTLEASEYVSIKTKKGMRVGKKGERLFLGTSICWCGKLFIHFFHHFMRSSSSLWSQDSFRSHTSLYMSSASSVTGEMMPTGLYIDAKNFSIPLFVASWSGTWKFTSNVSLTLFHDTPNIFNSNVLVFNSCLSNAISGFVADMKSTSSFTFKCHLSNLNFESPKYPYKHFLDFLNLFICSVTSNKIINIHAFLDFFNMCFRFWIVLLAGGKALLDRAITKKRWLPKSKYGSGKPQRVNVIWFYPFDPMEC